ncbi:unnamed protein product [Rotaria sp. Silwood2]|nr:unnamed protein product [Rotaria sp. Silwood2]CAF2699991.1 unnamed protein product [Rotaria sp. Silwood2]CAF3122804.1 unnamed protein product [Rotaria sp. Silwood2]CAF3940969.1 unnamed protein product [Rotaria sp. Silwood2]CAF3955568.1 unnamed protein product [Rotaria sp. Silwood2]
MITTNNSLSIVPSSSFGFNHNHQELNEDDATKMSSSTSLDMMRFKNNNFPSMMIINDQQDANIDEDKDSFHLTSAVMNAHSSSVHYNDHRSRYVYALDVHQEIIIKNNNDNKEQGTTKNSLNILSNDLNEDEHCQVCGDLASGWHCGAITCEACKKFFLRSISTCVGKKQYKCPRDFRCSITKRSRTQCQYCRFQKCISAGMKAHESIGSKTEDLYKKLPCLICNASASGIHFGTVTCEACKGFFRRSIKENAPERYHCTENNNCEIISTSKITCRACRFRKCIEAGMSMNASRIGRQSNLFKESIRQLQNKSTTMATVIDSARIASMAKKRKTKTKTGKIFAPKNEIDIELSPTIKEFIEKAYTSYLIYLKDLPRCIPRETVWSTMASQMTIYAQALMNFCQRTIPGFINMSQKYEIISSSINSVIMVTLLSGKTLMKSSYENIQPTWNYWQAESTLSMELNAHVPHLTQAEYLFRSFESTLRGLRLDEREFSLLLLMIITRHNLNLINEDNKSWSKCQYECVEAFSEYTQAHRLDINGEISSEFYDIVFLVSQLRSLNRRITQCFMNLPWPYVRNLPSFFYRIFVPSFDSSLSAVNSTLYNNYIDL